MKYEDIDEVMSIAEQAVGKTFGEIDKNNRSEIKTKGAMGHIIEESLYGYQINSNAAADFEDLDLELKVTPVKVNRNKTISAKERLVLNIINYMTEAFETFYTSSFWTKNKRLLLFFYLWQKDVDIKDYKILETLLYDYPAADLEIIKDDWQIIQNKIKAGKAHELSEGDTMYLGACTKGSSAKDVRQQPFSDIPAKQRAYSLKQSYMTSLVRQLIDAEKLTSITDAESLKNRDFEAILNEKFNPYVGMSIDQISQSLNLEINLQFKSRVQQLASSILGIKGTKLDKIEEFSKANIEIKTVRLEPSGLPKESMSFEQIDFDRWIEGSFEESQVYEKFEQTKFLFVVFQYEESETKNKHRDLYFKGIKLWNMPEEVIQTEIKDLWEEVRTILLEGVKIEKVPYGESYRVHNNLPKSNFNGVAHIRPKARNADDKIQLPDGQYITKQTYWLDRRYIAKILKSV